MSGATKLHTEPGRRLLVVEPFAEAARALGFPDPVAIGALLRKRPGATGRARTAIVPLPHSNWKLHVRSVRHGGWLAGITGGALLGPRRPEAEIVATLRLRERGAPVPQPVLSASWRRAGPVWSAVVATLHVEAAADGFAFLDADPDAKRLRRATRAAGHALRRFHDAGGRHADLHLKNLLVRERPDPDVLVIDLDRTRAGRPPGATRRMRELMRLYRSLVKRGHADRLGVRGCVAFLSAYTGRDRALRRQLLHSLPRERRRLAWHRAGYRIARSLSTQRSS